MAAIRQYRRQYGTVSRQDLSYSLLIRNGPPSAALFLPIGHNVGGRQEVDTVMDEARKAGAHILKPATDTFWGGYAGYFQDPDGHVWEIVWNPAFAPED